MLRSLYDAFPPSIIGILVATGAVFWISLFIYALGQLAQCFIEEE